LVPGQKELSYDLSRHRLQHLNLFVEKGLLRQFVFTGGATVFDTNVGNHRHFIDEPSGKIYDLPWDSLAVSKIDALKGFQVRDYHV